MVIIGLDEIGGMFYLVGYLDVMWRDDFIVWNIGNVDEMMMLYMDIWILVVMLYILVSFFLEFGVFDDLVKIFKDGMIIWCFGLVIESGCVIDVSYYLFDI